MSRRGPFDTRALANGPQTCGRWPPRLLHSRRGAGCRGSRSARAGRSGVAARRSRRTGRSTRLLDRSFCTTGPSPWRSGSRQRRPGCRMLRGRSAYQQCSTLAVRFPHSTARGRSRAGSSVHPPVGAEGQRTSMEAGTSCRTERMRRPIAVVTGRLGRSGESLRLFGGAGGPRLAGAGPPG